MSWQRPDGPASRGGCARAGVVLRLCLLALTLAGGAASSAQQPYALLGQAAPDFALRAASGANVRLSEHRGEVVVLSFWSSRCYPCRAQLAALGKSLATYRSAGLAVYGIGVDDDRGAVAASSRTRWPWISRCCSIPSKAVSRGYQVDNLPMTVLIDRNGTVRYVLRDYSAASAALYLQQLRALLNE